jgi:ABC-type transport system involved in multi-copper enzyme maturation permease subunit
VIAGAYLFGQGCFVRERQRSTLELLLALPITPQQLVLTKFASLFSITLFSVNAPALVLGEPQFLFRANAGALFLASASMAASILATQTWISQAPFWLALVAIAFRPSHPDQFHLTALSIAGYAGAAVAVALSTIFGPQLTEHSD